MKRVRSIMLQDRVKDGMELKIVINSSLEDIETLVNKLKLETAKPIADFDILKKVCTDLIRRLPLPIFQYDNNFILRARPNYGGEVFNKKSEISYNPILSKVDIGRFNLAGQPVFYGAASMADKDYNGPMTAICESFKELLDKHSKFKEQYLTIGKWDVVKPLQLLVLTFYDKAVQNNSQIKEMNPVFNQFTEAVHNEEDNKKVQMVMRYFSESAGKPYDTDNSYLLTTAFYHSLRDQYGKMMGILYSSAGTDNYGLNIVVPKEVIDEEYLKLTHAVMYKCRPDPSHSKTIGIFPCSRGSDIDFNDEFQIQGIR